MSGDYSTTIGVKLVEETECQVIIGLEQELN